MNNITYKFATILFKLPQYTTVLFKLPQYYSSCHNIIQFAVILFNLPYYYYSSYHNVIQVARWKACNFAIIPHPYATGFQKTDPNRTL